MRPDYALLALSVIAFLAALWITGQMRRYALKHRLMDEVGERSSHSMPTPRSGGVSIVVVGLAAFAVAIGLGFPAGWSIALLAGGAAVALIGWIDDHGHISPLVRLVVHFVAAVWAVWWIGPIPLELLGLNPEMARFAAPFVSVFGIVWLINLYNFMDGIDGIAGSEAVCVTLGLAFLLGWLGYGVAEVAPPVLLAAAALGFLWWNWPPAQIFMGDTSSGFLGFVLAAFVLIAGQLNSALSVAVVILLGVFVVDATVTLVRRALRRERLHQAHRSHGYQALARRMGRHLPVTCLTIAINSIVLLPLAWLAVPAILDPIVCLLAAYGALALGAIALGAGRSNG